MLSHRDLQTSCSTWTCCVWGASKRFLYGLVPFTVWPGLDPLTSMRQGVRHICLRLSCAKVCVMLLRQGVRHVAAPRCAPCCCAQASPHAGADVLRAPMACCCLHKHVPKIACWPRHFFRRSSNYNSYTFGPRSAFRTPPPIPAPRPL